MPLLSTSFGASVKNFGLTSGTSSVPIVGDFESIATVTVGVAGQANIEFTSIPATYTHLQLRLFTKTNRSNYALDDMNIRLNSDTGANYSIHGIYQFSGVNPLGGGNQSSILVQGASGGNTVSNLFGIGIIDLLDYKNTNMYKTIRIFSGSDSNQNASNFGLVAINSGNWRNTNAITSITMSPGTGTAYVQYSHAALYGIN
jgi:hypothetical protein